MTLSLSLSLSLSLCLSPSLRQWKQIQRVNITAATLRQIRQKKKKPQKTTNKQTKKDLARKVYFSRRLNYAVVVWLK